MTGRRLVAASESAPVGVDPSHDCAAGAVSEASQRRYRPVSVGSHDPPETSRFDSDTTTRSSDRPSLRVRSQPYTFWRLDKPGCRYRTVEDRKALQGWLGLDRIPG